MGQILRDIYSDVTVAPFLGLKGGTCAYFFYDLPRFSVDLDFDFLADSAEQAPIVFEKIKTILQKYGVIKDEAIKRNTLFFMLSYGEEDHNIKVEISTRVPLPDLKKQYEMKELLGMAMLVAKPDYLFAGKLSALALRKETAMRDIYDVHFFAKKNMAVNEDAVKAFTGKSLKQVLPQCIEVVEKLKDNQLLQGLGELLDVKEKQWVKQNLKAEALFMLRNYQSALR